MVGISCQLTTLGRSSACPTNHDALAPHRAAIRSAQIAHGYVRSGTTAASTCWQAVAACPGQILLLASRGSLGRAPSAATRPHLPAYDRLRAPPTATLCGTHVLVSHVVSLSPPRRCCRRRRLLGRRRRRDCRRRRCRRRRRFCGRCSSCKGAPPGSSVPPVPPTSRPTPPPPHAVRYRQKS